MKKDVLILCQFFYPEYISSATLPYDTAQKLVKHGYNVDVITGYPKEYISKNKKIKRKEVVKQINISRVKYIQFKRTMKLGRLINYFSFTLMMLFRLFKIRKYKYVFVYSNPPLLIYLAYLAKKIFGTKIIFIAYDIYPEIAINTGIIKQKSIIARLMRYINKKVYPNIEKIIVLSEDMRIFIENNREIDKNKINVIPNWHAKLSKKNLYSNIKFSRLESDTRFKVAYLGNLGIAQDVNTIVDFIKLNKSSKKFSFIFAGHGNKLEVLKELVKENYDNVYSYEFLQGDDFEYVLKNTDVFLLSLHENITGLASPSKLYSYLASGKPILAILDENSKLAEYISSESIGFCSSSSDIEKMQSNLLEISDNKLKYNNMSESVTNIFNKYYETEIATQKYVDLLKELEVRKNV